MRRRPGSAPRGDQKKKPVYSTGTSSNRGKSATGKQRSKSDPDKKPRFSEHKSGGKSFEKSTSGKGGFRKTTASGSRRSGTTRAFKPEGEDDKRRFTKPGGRTFTKREGTFEKRRNTGKEEGGFTGEERRKPRTFTRKPQDARPPFKQKREFGDSDKSQRRDQGDQKPTRRFSSREQNRSFSKKPRTSERKAYDKPERRGKSRSDSHAIAPSETGTIRLNRYISNAGICSRREADKLIGAGLVSVNGNIITEMGYQVNPGDVVKYNNSKLSTEKKVYVLMNKPKDTITTLDDPDKRKIVTDLLKGADLPRVYPVGRLDRNTTGVLLLTNDGEMAQRLMHPKYEVQKIYKATLNRNIKGEDLWTLTNGVELEDGFIKPDTIALPDPKVKNEVGVEIHSGRNRIIHRMFEHLGYSLDKLDRVWYAGLSRSGLKRGDWRVLEDREINALKKLVKMK